MVSAELCFSLVWFYLLYCWFLVCEPGEHVLFSPPPFFLKSSFPARSSELMRVWPPAGWNVCAVRCKDPWKRHNSKYTCRGLPKNPGAQFITSENDTPGLRQWTACAGSVCECVLRSGGCVHWELLERTPRRRLFGWFPSRLKTGQFPCWHFSLFIVIGVLAGSQRAGASHKAGSWRRERQFNTWNYCAIPSCRLLERWGKTCPWNEPLPDIQAFMILKSTSLKNQLKNVLLTLMSCLDGVKNAEVSGQSLEVGRCRNACTAPATQPILFSLVNFRRTLSVEFKVVIPQ